MNEIQIIDFIEIYNIKHSLIENFNNVLQNNSIEDLDITTKNLSIETENLIDEVWILFKTKIKQDVNEIGHYALQYDLNGEFIEEYFTIYH